jgi:signal transduction histidine kinase
MAQKTNETSTFDAIRQPAKMDNTSAIGRSTRNLLTKYLLATGSVIVISMTLLAYLLCAKVSSLVTQYVALDASAAITASLTQYAQELRASPRLSDNAIAQIDALKSKDAGIHSIKIWLPDGTIAYATDRQQIGHRYESAALADAFAGKVVATYDDMVDPENHRERQVTIPLIEVYAPIYDAETRKILAVGEYYKDASRLAEELSLIRIVTAGVVGTVTLPMVFVLYLVTRRADRIAKQARLELKEKAEVASALARRNDELRQAAEAARQDSIASNELFLQQIGQDLHDGPIQLLSLMAMKLSSDTSPPLDGGETQSSLHSATGITEKVLKELRDISAGLVLPELESLTPEQAIQLAIREHEAASGTTVDQSIDALPADLARSLKICLFRIVQEGLNNALRHASGHGQRVTARRLGDEIEISVNDKGRHTSSDIDLPLRRVPLGLIGLRRRVTLLQGTFDFIENGAGAELRARLPINSSGL